MLALLVCTAAMIGSPAAPTELDVRAFGAKGDSVTDDTGAFRRAFTAARKVHENVLAPSGNYLLRGHLEMPEGVALQGSWESVPSHTGIRSPGQPKPTDGGTTFLVSPLDPSDGEPFLTIGTDATVKGIVFYYPTQETKEEPRPFPFTVALRGDNPSIQDCEFLNSYDAIDASQNARHLIRNISGQPIHVGVYVDANYDIGRIENVHFNPWFSISTKLSQWQMEHGVAFVFGRSDWEYVLNTFCFGYNIGYKFIETKNGVCNGNFLGIGADDCYESVRVEQCAPYGLLITNGEFTSFHGPDPTMVHATATNQGVVRFSNCAFWGPCNQVAEIEGRGTVGFGDCTFVQWDGRRLGRPAIHVLGGSVLVLGCEFREDKLGIKVEGGAKSVVVSDCLSPQDLKIECLDTKVLHYRN